MFSDPTRRNKLFQDWIYNGKNVEHLSVLYQKIAFYRKVTGLGSELGLNTVRSETGHGRNTMLGDHGGPH